MKIIKIMSLMAIIMFSVSTMAQEQNKTEKITIKTSVVCKMCKERVEHDMAYEKGVKEVTVDLETKEVTIVYRTDKTNPEKLREAISKIGYDADDVEADEKAYEKLPKCCKKDAPPH